MKKIAFFDTKPYDRDSFSAIAKDFGDYEIYFFENKLNADTARLAEGYDAVCAFVNDEITAEVIEILYALGIKLIAMRCAGYSNIDVRAAYNKINIVRVPAYSPYAVAEHAAALLLCLNRKIHKAYNRTRDFNFSITGFTGMDLYGKTVGIIGAGKIGRCFGNICRGFGMKILAYDLYPSADSGMEFTSLEELFKRSDIISLHCPLNEQTRHILNKEAFEQMKPGVIIINTSRGALVSADALLDALNSQKVGAAGLDVYEEESDLFFEDFSGEVITDKVLSLLLSKPNVIITSHQGFLTKEALKNIAEATFQNLDEYFSGAELTNEICYSCNSDKVVENCRSLRRERCF